MMIAGLTGSIGMGKSTVAAMFREEGVPVFDADAVVHALQGPEGLLLDAIEAAFPGTTSIAGVDRAALGALVLGDPVKIARLEAIVHPAVAEARTAFLREYADAALVVLDIPLLFEKGGDASVDTTIVVSAPPEKQFLRVLARPGMTTERFEHILALQMPDADKRARADHIIDNGSSFDATLAQVRALIACLKAPTGR